MGKEFWGKGLLYVVLSLGIIVGFSSPAFASSKVKSIIIGVPVPGDFHGKATIEAIDLAVKEINATGGVKVGGEMRPFEVKSEDTRGMEPGVPITESLLAIERLITREKCDFLVGGPVRSEASYAARPMVTRYKKVWIITVGTYSPKFCDAEKYPYTFRITGDVRFQVPKVWIGMLLALKKKFGFNKVFLIGEDNKVCRASVKIMGKVAGKVGLEVVGHKIFPLGSTDFALGLLEAKKKGAQMLNVTMTMPETNIMVKQWHDLKIPAIIVGYIGPAFHNDFWDATGGKCNYLIDDILIAGNVPSNATPMTMKFVKAFEKEYGYEPDSYGHSSSYMGVYLLKDAIERAGSLNADAVAKALEKVDIEGVYGRMRFDKNHEIIFSPDFNPKEGCVTSAFQWQNGKRVTVFPETIAEGEILLPPWMQ